MRCLVLRAPMVVFCGHVRQVCVVLLVLWAEAENVKIPKSLYDVLLVLEARRFSTGRGYCTVHCLHDVGSTSQSDVNGWMGSDVPTDRESSLRSSTT